MKEIREKSNRAEGGETRSTGATPLERMALMNARRKG